MNLTRINLHNPSEGSEEPWSALEGEVVQLGDPDLGLEGVEMVISSTARRGGTGIVGLKGRDRGVVLVISPRNGG
jgi:hypothetical protein